MKLAKVYSKNTLRDQGGYQSMACIKSVVPVTGKFCSFLKDFIYCYSPY